MIRKAALCVASLSLLLLVPAASANPVQVIEGVLTAGGAESIEFRLPVGGLFLLGTPTEGERYGFRAVSDPGDSSPQLELVSVIGSAPEEVISVERGIVTRRGQQLFNVAGQLYTVTLHRVSTIERMVQERPKIESAIECTGCSVTCSSTLSGTCTDCSATLCCTLTCSSGPSCSTCASSPE